MQRLSLSCAMACKESDQIPFQYVGRGIIVFSFEHNSQLTEMTVKGLEIWTGGGSKNLDGNERNAIIFSGVEGIYWEEFSPLSSRSSIRAGGSSLPTCWSSCIGGGGRGGRRKGSEERKRDDPLVLFLISTLFIEKYSWLYLCTQ